MGYEGSMPVEVCLHTFLPRKIVRSCYECALSLLPDDCPLQRLAFQIRFSDLVRVPCWNASLFLPFALSLSLSVLLSPTEITHDTAFTNKL